MTTATTIGQKLWNYCDVLRNAGQSYGDYLEQLTYLIFLKMMHELTQPPLSLLSDHQPPPIPVGCDWPSPDGAGRRGAGNPLSLHPGNPVPPAGHAGGDIRQGPEAASRNLPC